MFGEHESQVHAIAVYFLFSSTLKLIMWHIEKQTPFKRKQTFLHEFNFLKSVLQDKRKTKKKKKKKSNFDATNKSDLRKSRAYKLKRLSSLLGCVQVSKCITSTITFLEANKQTNYKTLNVLTTTNSNDNNKSDDKQH